MRDDPLRHQIRALFAGCQTLEEVAVRLSKMEGARLAAEVERDALKAQVEALKGIRDIQGQLIDARTAELHHLEREMGRRPRFAPLSPDALDAARETLREAGCDVPSEPLERALSAALGRLAARSPHPVS